MKQFLWIVGMLALSLSLSCSSNEDSDSLSDTPSLTQCTTTCDSLYGECGLEMVDNSDVALTESECVDSCQEEKSEVVDCLEEADCSDLDEVNACFLLGAESEDSSDDSTDDSTDDDSSDDDECDSDSDCSGCQRCSDGDCRSCGSGPFGCYC